MKAFVFIASQPLGNHLLRSYTNVSRSTFHDSASITRSRENKQARLRCACTQSTSLRSANRMINTKWEPSLTQTRTETVDHLGAWHLLQGCSGGGVLKANNIKRSEVGLSTSFGRSSKEF